MTSPKELVETWARQAYPDMSPEDSFTYEWTSNGLLLCWYDPEVKFSGHYKDVPRLELDDLIQQLVEIALSQLNERIRTEAHSRIIRLGQSHIGCDHDTCAVAELGKFWQEDRDELITAVLGTPVKKCEHPNEQIDYVDYGNDRIPYRFYCPDCGEDRQAGEQS